MAPRRLTNDTRPPAAIKRYPNRSTNRPSASRREWRARDRARARAAPGVATHRSPITLDELSTVLALSAGVQLWVTGADIPIPLKTSPSGGARHATEVTSSRRTSTGLEAGHLHYAPARHGLTRIARAASKARVRSTLPGSDALRRCSGHGFLHVSLRPYPVAVSICACLSSRAHRSGSRLPVVPPGGDEPRPGAFQRHGAGRFRHRRRFGDRRQFRSPCSMLPASAGRPVGSPGHRSRRGVRKESDGIRAYEAA